MDLLDYLEYTNEYTSAANIKSYSSRRGENVQERIGVVTVVVSTDFRPSAEKESRSERH